MNATSLWNIANVTKYYRQICVLFYVYSRQICFALKDELCFNVQLSLSTDFRIRIMPFLMKVLDFNCLGNTGKLKKSNLRVKFVAPKSGNRCHFGAD